MHGYREGGRNVKLMRWGRDAESSHQPAKCVWGGHRLTWNCTGCYVIRGNPGEGVLENKVPCKPFGSRTRLPEGVMARAKEGSRGGRLCHQIVTMKQRAVTKAATSVCP